VVNLIVEFLTCGQVVSVYVIAIGRFTLVPGAAAGNVCAHQKNANCLRAVGASDLNQEIQVISAPEGVAAVDYERGGALRPNARPVGQQAKSQLSVQSRIFVVSPWRQIAGPRPGTKDRHQLTG